MPGDLDGFKKALAATRGDKRKARKQWQEAERRAAKLEGELEALRRMAPQAKNEPEAKAEPSEEFDWENPTAFVKRMAQQAIPDIDAVSVKARADISEFYARQSHADYEDKKAYFMSRAAQDPSLLREVFSAPAPAEALYQKAAALKEREDFDRDPNAWRDAERERLRAEMSGDTTESAPQRPAKTPIPRSIAGARGSGVGVTREWVGPRKTEDVFG